MKLRFLLTVLTFALCAAPALTNVSLAQEKPKEQPKLSEEESKQIDKMNKATTTAEKTKFGIEFIKKFKKNTAYREKVASYLSNQIFNEKDPNAKRLPHVTYQRVLAERLQVMDAAAIDWPDRLRRPLQN